MGGQPRPRRARSVVGPAVLAVQVAKAAVKQVAGVKVVAGR